MTETFRNGVGRLTVDRYNFQSHIDGNDFRQDATTIDLNPTLTISGTEQTTVQGALTASLPFLVPPVLPEASDTVKGITYIKGDVYLDDMAPGSIRVSGLHGRSVNSLAPSSGQVLTWSGAYWGPANVPIQFSAGNDLDGTSTNQEVIGITGISDQVSVKCNTIWFDGDLLTPQITQEQTRTAGATLNIAAQNSSLLTGGDVVISSGYGFSETGSVKLQLQPAESTFSTLLHATSIDGRKVLGLVSDTPITSAEMPINTGDLVVYLKNTSTIPSISTGVKPVGGCVLYSSAGKLCIKQSDGEVKVVGTNSLTTPIYYYGTYNDNGYPVEFHKFTVTSLAGASQTLHSYTFDEGTNVVMAEIDAVGFSDDGLEMHNSKRIISFESISSSGNYFAVSGSESVLHAQEIVVGAGVFNSVFYDSGFHTAYTIEFMSGSHSLKDITWSISIKLHAGYAT